MASGGTECQICHIQVSFTYFIDLLSNTRLQNMAVVIIDLTTSKEYCAKCSRVLREGDGLAARVFASKSHVHTIPQAICGTCLSPSENPYIGSKQVRELFATACQICEQRLDLLCTPCGRSPKDRLARSHLIETQGHIFCNSCTTQNKSYIHRGCPICRKSLSKLMDDLVPVRMVNHRVISRCRPISIELTLCRRSEMEGEITGLGGEGRFIWVRRIPRSAVE
jgi:hypothetical protein